ncbi:MAG: GerMN domain-containing protein [Selenomonadaceae bacterium]|nr:GerMN domain-containing protein [Selenomonadaceae bacterium]
MSKKLLAAVLMAVSVLTAGCEEQQPPVENPPKIETPEPKETTEPKAPPDERPEPKAEQPPTPTPKADGSNVEKMQVKVYYPDESGLRLVEVERQVETSKGENKYEATVEAMMQAPKEQELTEIFPKHAKLLGVTVDDGIANVNFDEGLQKHFVGGSAGETFLVGSVVNALTNFDEVKGVRFLIDGKEIDSLAGHMDLSEPVTRMNELMEKQ